MSAARHLPITETVWSISIDSSFTPSHQGIIVAYGDTVNFTNNSGVDISIQFASNAPGQSVGPNLGVPNTQTVGFIAPNYDAAANYSILVGSIVQPGGPYAIQVGNGCMYISITSTTSTPDTVSIPIGGQVKMYSTDTTYSIAWPGCPSTGGPFSSALNQVVSGASNNTNRQENIGTATLYNYTITASPMEGNGGGKVKVVSS